ncbi:hypothetical protein AALB64_11500 [Lachnospiraceae bacterium 45-P1]
MKIYRNLDADRILREPEVDRQLLEGAKVFHFGTLSMTERCPESHAVGRRN